MFSQRPDRATAFLTQNILDNINMLNFERGPEGRASPVTPDGVPGDPMTHEKLSEGSFAFHVRDFYGLDLLSLSRARDHGERIVWNRSGFTSLDFLKRLKKPVVFTNAMAVRVTDVFQTNRDRIPVPKGARSSSARLRRAQSQRFS